jgi:gas vesicle protein
MNGNTDRALVFLFGVAAGGIAGLLLAPYSGREARKRLRRGADDAIERGEEFIDDARETVSSKASEYSRRVRGAAHDVADTAREGAASVRGAAASAGNTLRRNR